MRHVRAIFAVAVAALASQAVAEGGPRGGPAALRAAHAQLGERLSHSPYGRPLWLEAREGDRVQEGDAYAIVAQPFERVAAALEPVGNWCEALILPFNVKRCESAAGPHGARLTLFLGRKIDSPEFTTFRLQLDYALVARSRDYFELALSAADGPMDTRNYRLTLRAMPLEDGRTFIHMGYSYGYGALSRTAMRAYLATLGASKVGFTSEGGGLVKGMRGVMERNTMRYYLAIDAYLASLEGPAATRVARRLNDWFSATERYPRQLGEDVARPQYVAAKLREYARITGASVRAGG